MIGWRIEPRDTLSHRIYLATRPGADHCNLDALLDEYGPEPTPPPATSPMTPGRLSNRAGDLTPWGTIIAEGPTVSVGGCTLWVETPDADYLLITRGTAKIPARVIDHRIWRSRHEAIRDQNPHGAAVMAHENYGAVRFLPTPDFYPKEAR